MEKVLTRMTIGISEFRSDIQGALKRASKKPFAVLSNNKPSFYVISPELFEKLSEAVFDLEIADTIQARKARGHFVPVNVEDL
jgi:antitoxin StbD